MLYNHAMQLHKILHNPDFPTTIEHTMIADQIICTGRQLRFKLFKNNKTKIGMNTSANKMYCISDMISLDMLNLKFVHFKKLAKLQFFKFGKT